MFQCEDGRQPMLMFMEKPSKKLYPDYYKVIDSPIDMLTIEANIKAEKYTCEEEILNDFKVGCCYQIIKDLLNYNLFAVTFT